MFGIFILGFGVVGFAWLLEWHFAPPLWVHAVIWIPMTIVAALAILPPLKGLTVAVQHRFRSVNEPERPGAT